MSPEAERAHGLLIEGMVERTPACRGIDAFTADYLTPEARESLKPVCAACEVRLLCRAYVDLERPPVGYWAGEYYGPERAAQPRKPRAARRKTPRTSDTRAEDIARARAHAARLRKAVERGELETWYLDAAAEYEAQADAIEQAVAKVPLQ